MKLASAATSVIAVIARRRSGASWKCLASTVNAGSYSTAAMTRPIANHSA